MRIDSLALSEALQQKTIEPRFFVSVAFDFDQTDVWHFTSHGDVPTPDPAKTIQGVLTGSSGGNSTLKSRDFKSTLGAISFTLLNKSNAVSQLLRQKKASSKSLARKVVKVYMGCKGFALTDYELRFTQVCKSIEATTGGYRVACDDVLRLVKTKVFIMRKTQLVADIAAPTDGISSLDIKVLKGWDGRTHTGQSTAKIGYLQIGSGDNAQIIQYTDYDAVNNTYLNCTPAFAGAWQSVKAVGENGKSQGVEIEEYQYLEGPAVKVLYALLTGIWLGQSGERLPDNWHCGVALDHISTAQFNGIGDDLFLNGNDNVGPKIRFKGLKSQDAKRLMEKDILPVISCFTPILATGELGLKRRQPVRAESAYQALIDNSVINLQQLKSVKINYNEDRIVNQVLVKWAQSGDDFLRANVVVSQDSIDVYGQRDPVVVELRGVFGDQYALDNIYDMLEDYMRMYSSEIITTKLSLLPSMTGIEVGDVVRVKLAYVDDHTGAAEFDHRMRVVGVSFNQFTGKLDVDLEGSAQTYGIDREGLGYGVELDFYTRNGTDLEQAFPAAFTRTGNIVTLNQDIDLTGADKLYDNPDDGYDPAAVFYLDLGGVGAFNQNAKINISKNVFLKFSGHWYQNDDVYGVGGGHAGGDARRHDHDVDSLNSIYTSANGREYPVSVVDGYISDLADNTYPLPNQGFLGYKSYPQDPVMFLHGVSNILTDNKDPFHIRPIEWNYAELVLSLEGASDAGPLPELPSVSFKRDSPDSLDYLCQIPSDLRGGGGLAGGNIWRAVPNSRSFKEVVRDDGEGNQIRESFYTGEVAALGGTGGAGGAGLVVLHRGHTPALGAKINLSGGDAESNYQRLNSFPVNDVSYPCDIAAGVGAPGKPGGYYEIVDGALSESESLFSSVEQKYGRATPYGDAALYVGPIARDFNSRGGAYGPIQLYLDFPSSRPASVNSFDGHAYSANSGWAFRGEAVDLSRAGLGVVDSNNYTATHAKSIRLTEKLNIAVGSTEPAANPLSVNAVLQQYDSLSADKVAIEIEVQPPADTNYAYSIVEIKKQGDWERVGTDPEVSYIAKKDGSDYVIRARSVSQSGVESVNGPQTQITVPSVSGGSLSAPTSGGAQVFERGAKLQWQAPEDRGLLNAEVYLSSAGAVFTPSPSNLADTVVGRSATLAGLAPDTNYWAKVRVVDACGTKSGYITIPFKTLALQEVDSGPAPAPTFYQSSFPASPQSGWLCYRSDQGNRLYRYSGSAWQAIVDQDLVNAKQAADQALEDAGEANNKALDAESLANTANDKADQAGVAAVAADSKAVNADSKAQSALDTAIKVYKTTGVPPLSLGKQDDLCIQTFTAIVKGEAKEMKSVWQKLLVNGVLAWVVIASTGCSFDEVYGANRPADNATQGADWNSDLQNIPDTLAYIDSNDISYSQVWHERTVYKDLYNSVGINNQPTVGVTDSLLGAGVTAESSDQERKFSGFEISYPNQTVSYGKMENDWQVSFCGRFIESFTGPTGAVHSFAYLGRGRYTGSGSHVGILNEDGFLLGVYRNGATGDVKRVLLSGDSNGSPYAGSFHIYRIQKIGINIKFFVNSGFNGSWQEIGSITNALFASSEFSQNILTVEAASGEPGHLSWAGVSLGEVRYHEKIGGA